MESDKIVSGNKKIEDMTNIEVCDLIWNALNKATLKGVYTIDEAFILKVLFDKLKNNVN